MITQARFDALVDAGAQIGHVGVKGMKWGVRKDRVSTAAKSAGKAAAKASGSAAKVVGKTTASDLVEIGRGATVGVLSVAAGLVTTTALADGGHGVEGSLYGGVAGGVAARTALTVATSRTPHKVAGRIAKKTYLNAGKLAVIAAAGATAHKAMEGKYFATTLALIEKS